MTEIERNYVHALADAAEKHLLEMSDVEINAIPGLASKYVAMACGLLGESAVEAANAYLLTPMARPDDLSSVVRVFAELRQGSKMLRDVKKLECSN